MTWAEAAVTHAERLASVMSAMDSIRPRTQQKALGISAIGKCHRYAGYVTHGTDPTDEKRSHPSALLGTLLHEALLPVLAREWGGQHSVPVEVSLGDDLPPIPGEADLVVNDEVIDLKTGTEAVIERVVRDGQAKPDHHRQTNLYRLGLVQSGRKINWASILYLGRSRGETVSFESPYDPVVIDEARQWWRSVHASPKPEALDRSEHGPGLSIICDGCEFRSRCWPNAQATILDEGGDEATESALTMLRDALDRTNAAKKDADFAKAVLAGTMPGEYGRWRTWYQGGGARLDQPEAKRLLVENGLPVPMKTTEKSLRVGVSTASKGTNI
ncbi:MAG: PD-(D/E)XK nuclease family protein [Rhodoglobus sp.]